MFSHVQVRQMQRSSRTTHRPEQGLQLQGAACGRCWKSMLDSMRCDVLPTPRLLRQQH